MAASDHAGGGPIALRGWRLKDKASHDGLKALMAASQNGHLEVARLLCKVGADNENAANDCVH